MPAHIHADLMKQYYEDALETDKPWERWQFKLSDSGKWIGASAELAFSPKIDYRRKPVALCQVEGRDVFVGDKLWHVEKGWLTAIVMDGSNLVCTMEDGDTWRPSFSYLSWTKPAKTKTVYQWAMRCQGTPIWYMTAGFFETEQEAARNSGDSTAKFRRLDWTALEVPA